MPGDAGRTSRPRAMNSETLGEGSEEEMAEACEGKDDARPRDCGAAHKEVPLLAWLGNCRLARITPKVSAPAHQDE